jgi:uncharacterized protein
MPVAAQPTGDPVRPTRDIYNLSATLFTPETLYQERIDEERWAIFAPDFEGYPVLIDSNTRAMLDAFRGGAVVGNVLAIQRDFVSSLFTVSALEERGFLRGAPAKLPYPTPPRLHKQKDFSIWLHITNACNLKCAYCFVGEKTSDGMSPEVMSKVARNIRTTTERYGTENIYVKFAGGEPTIFVPRMERFRNILLEEMEGSGTNVRFGILSNGTLVGDKLLDFLKRTDSSISISLDGYGASHDTFRIYASGRGSWDTVSENIESLVSNGIKPYIMATISQESCRSLPALVRWIFAHGLRCRLSVVRNPNSSWAPIQIGVAGLDRRAEYEAMNQKLAAAFDEAFAVLEDPDIVIDLRYSLDLCELNFEHPTQGVTCGIGDNHLVIKPDGTLVSCPMTVMEKGVPSSGDLFATAAQTFLHSAADRQFVGPEDDCRHCQWFGVCSGGCPITNLRVKGYAFTRSPLCSFYKAVIPRYLRFYGTKLRQAEVHGLGAFPVSHEMPQTIASGC